MLLCCGVLSWNKIGSTIICCSFFLHFTFLLFFALEKDDRRPEGSMDRSIYRECWGKPTLSFLSWRAYGKQGITAVTREAEAILHALIMISSSIKLSLISPEPDCTMYTSSPRTDSPISTLQRQRYTTVQNLAKIWQKNNMEMAVRYVWKQ